MCAINGPHSAWEPVNSIEILHCLLLQMLLGGSDDVVGHASEDCGDNLVQHLLMEDCDIPVTTPLVR